MVTPVFINEFHYDNTGTDTGEFIEIVGPAGTDLTGWSLVLYNGASSSLAPYTTTSLSGVIPDLGSGFGAIAISYPSNGIQNGSPDGIALVDNTGGVVQFLSYEGTFTALSGPAAGLTSVDIGISQNGTEPAGASLQLTGTGTVYEDFTWTSTPTNTSGAINAGQTFVGTAKLPVINEVLASHTGTDNTEFVEIFGTPGASLEGLSLIVVESDVVGLGAIDRRIDFTATNVIGNNGFFLVGNPAGLAASYGVSPNLTIANDFLENNSLTVALVQTSSLTGTSVAGTEVVVDAVALTDGGAGDTFFFNAPVIGPDGSFFPAGARRVTDGVDTDAAADWVISDFNLGSANTPTAGSSGNGGGNPPPDAVTLISSIQGSGAVSGRVGQTVTIEAIVVGDFQDGDSDNSRDLRGFYVQEENSDSDGNAATSEGIFVFEGTGNFLTNVNVGDKVRITGTVSEFFGETQINNVSSITVVNSGNALPTAATISLPATGTTLSQDGDFQPDLEAFEGMRVVFSDQLTITEMFQLDRFNEIKLVQGDRPAQFTQTNTPDVAGYATFLQELGARTITYDDGLSAQNAAIENLDGFGPVFNTATAPRMGDTISGLTGVLSYQWAGNSASGATWRVRSTADGTNTFADGSDRLATPAPVGGSLKVASFNVLNYFTTLDLTGVTTANGSDPRGADSQAEFDRQTEKLVNTILAMDADILGLVELENDFLPGSSGNAIEFLVNKLNEVAGPGTYAWVNPGTQFVDASDAISVGVIYQTSSVRIAPGTTVEILRDEKLAGLGLNFGQPVFNGENTSRAPLAVSFQEVSTGGVFTVAVNHFKSKGGAGTGDDADIGDGAGAYNGTRLRTAQALDTWLDTDPTGSGDADVMIIGDLNSYAKEAPIQFLAEQGYVDLAQQFIGPAAYSYVFDGQTGTLDYALANTSLAKQVTGVTEWHVNSDEADALDYNLDFGRNPAIFDGTVPYRNSDHDPVIAGFNLTPTNQAPTAVGFANAIAALAESVNTASRIKLADVTIADDGRGTNVISLTGADASFFELDGNALFLKADTAIDFETKSNYAVTVNVDDAAVGASPDASNTFNLTITDVAETNLRFGQQLARLNIQVFQDGKLIGEERGKQNREAPSVAPFALFAIDSADSGRNAAFVDRTWLDQGEGIGIADGDDGNSDSRKRIDGDEVLGIAVTGFKAKNAIVNLDRITYTDGAKVRIEAFNGASLVDYQEFNLGKVPERGIRAVSFSSSDYFDTLHIKAADSDTKFTFRTVELPEAFAVNSGSTSSFQVNTPGFGPNTATQPLSASLPTNNITRSL